MSEREMVIVGGSRVGRAVMLAQMAAGQRPAQSAGQVMPRETPEQRARRERDEWNEQVEARKRAKGKRR